ncbi:ABC transporter permease subunit [Microbacterium sp. zg.Y1090]|uniref:ABC transporter permease subunit n=1 Tax=Microbacterium TaxID=33882 RepID=UPI00214C7E9D|nr:MULTISPECIES: ABC transporter permease subunit [unclassified Microbacterium]MCR2812230.1 ABC transporter permease subunit [Microbacterium sp. zg.Y1084]MCR2818332.1 ABC transporter permease subunit [Microbacterium sp. zg.Y1090]MDL5486144.1 ABC transporter permease subunit [Microbacterium sp. zg-Y1211]WIM29353.1 ABC transporter permease subunit [Microbacterium sp. zg-Y1090]
MSVPQEKAAAPAPQLSSPSLTPRGESHARNWRGIGWGFVVKLLLMAVVNAFGIMAAISAVRAESWLVLSVSILLLVAANVVYFTKRALPLKYLLPGLIFLLLFQVFIFVYTAYIAFTNYGSGHIGSQEQAVNAALIQGERRVDGSPTFPLTIIERGGEYGFAIVDDGDVFAGDADEPLSEVDDAVIGAAGNATEVPGWNVVPRAELLTDQALQKTVQSLRVPVSDDPNDGSIRTREGTTGAVYESTLVWDEDAQTITDTTSGTVYSANDRGSFVADDGTALTTGWYVNVGFDNFVRLFTEPRLVQPLLMVAGWTFAFAILSVVLSFGVGLLFALIFNDPRVRGRKWLRTLFILPYAFPAFMSALLFRGMFNAEFGVINDLFFFGAEINWLGDPWLARLAVLWVNLWLSYPYWFLVCTGALQALPADTLEAASLDGAGRFRQFRSIVLPLLLVSTAPLLISSFAFSFNNFTIIYMFNNGGPAIPGAPYALGSTDILISAIYDIAGISGGAADYGLASALSIIIFIIVGAISALAFRQTRKLEEYQ